MNLMIESFFLRGHRVPPAKPVDCSWLLRYARAFTQHASEPWGPSGLHSPLTRKRKFKKRRGVNLLVCTFLARRRLHQNRLPVELLKNEPSQEMLRPGASASVRDPGGRCVVRRHVATWRAHVLSGSSPRGAR